MHSPSGAVRTSCSNHLEHRTTRLFALFLPFLLAACSQYTVTLNETPIYTPPTLFTDFSTPDPNLRACLDQTIKDKGITDPSQLKQLVCTHAGIKDLEGLGRFTQLEAIDLSHNELITLAPLAPLSQLSQLLLEDNQLADASVLLNLPRLEKLDLRDNRQLACADLSQLSEISQAVILLPGQCEE